ncbi:MAG: PQQ-binding-like beta-propeller repeat protein [Planctomycetota bacterium]
MYRQTAIALIVSLVSLAGTNLLADDWPQFRGPLGNAVSGDTLPTEWSPSANLSWKTELPGPGASSPIIVNGRAFVTCYSGYGLNQESPGELEDLVRHLVCIDVQTGEQLWQKDVPAALPEDPYTGAGVPAHGYASHTPVSDGQHVYAFFGKSGVHAFDMDGNEMWTAEVGMESDPTRWGSSSSPVMFDDVVIVVASAESQSIIGFDKNTGEEVWRQEASGLDGMWGTPSLVTISDDRTDLVLAVAKEVWGLDPENGEMRWMVEANDAQHAYSSVVQEDGVVYTFSGRGGGSAAVEAGGEGDVTESNKLWSGGDTASFASPVGHDMKLYLVSRNILTVVDADSGEQIERVRLKGAEATGGRFGSLDYPSPVVAGDHLYYLNGSGQMFVMSLGENVEQIAVNRVTSEKEEFRGTPAISDGSMVIRSAKYLYCITDKGETVDPADQMQVDDDEEEAPEAGRGGPGGGGGPGGRGGGQRFDPNEIFNNMDTNGDEMLTADELEGNRMGERLMELDTNDDDAVSKDEFTSGIGALFSRGGGGGGGRRGGGGGYGRGEDNRPERPQRPEWSDN